MGNKIHSLKAIPPSQRNNDLDAAQMMQRLYRFATQKELEAKGMDLKSFQAFTATSLELIADELEIRLQRAGD